MVWKVDRIGRGEHGKEGRVEEDRLGVEQKWGRWKWKEMRREKGVEEKWPAACKINFTIPSSTFHFLIFLLIFLHLILFPLSYIHVYIYIYTLATYMHSAYMNSVHAYIHTGLHRQTRMHLCTHRSTYIGLHTYAHIHRHMHIVHFAQP